MSEKKVFVNPWLIISLALPVSVLYLVRVVVTSTSLPWAAIGYVTMGLSFGLLQSLFKVRHPYRVAFVSTALIPFLAYLIIAAIFVLMALFVLTTGTIPLMSGGVLPVAPTTYTERLGTFAGSILYCVAISLMVIPFGMIGVSGRFLGSGLLPHLVARITHRKTPLRREGGAVLLASPERRNISEARITAYATISAAIVSALASILIALFS